MKLKVFEVVELLDGNKATILENNKNSKESRMYYIYMLRCEDNSIYTGITTDINRRMKEHFSKNKKCAKYTLKHTAKKLESVWQTGNRVLT